MNIFIAGLSYEINEADLASMFEEYGAVSSAKVIMDRDTNRSKGYGFVEMENDEEANKAIAELNGAELNGRTLAVSEARPPQERNNSYGNRGGGGRGRGGYGNDRGGYNNDRGGYNNRY